MVRSKARIHTIFGKVVLIKKNPWTNPKLAEILRSIGKEPKKTEILATPVPWTGDISKAPRSIQIMATVLSIVGSQTKNMKQKDRIPFISRMLRGVKVPEEFKVKKPEKLPPFHVRINIKDEEAKAIYNDIRTRRVEFEEIAKKIASILEARLPIKREEKREERVEIPVVRE
jgi:hypothetical protein